MSATAGFARPPARSRGIALLVALILVALSTTIAAALSFDTGLGLRRAQGGLAQDQALLLAGGAEAIAAEILVDELAAGNAPVHFAQRWHNPIGPLEPLPGVRVSAQLEDLQGRFNLNSLVGADGRTDPVALQVFRRLLLRLDLEPEWADRMADWIDADDQALAAGAEDAAYSSALPAYRTPGRPVTTVAELLALPDFGAARYARLAPFVAALPRDARINLCTASAQLLDALSDEQQWSGAPEALARNRERECFPSPATFRAALPADAYERLQRSVGLGDRSKHFGLEVRAGVGSTEFSLYSLLRSTHGAEGPARVRVMSRQFSE
jgi:general secretion pathway protein K